MRELDFNAEPNELLEYAIKQVHLAESGDAQAINYIEYLWDVDAELLEEAYFSYYNELEDMQ